MGGGKALVNAYYRSAEALGVAVRYDAPVDRIETADGRFVAAHVGKRAHRGARVRRGERRLRVEPRVAARRVGPERPRRVARRQLRHPRHPLQHGRRAARPDRPRRGRRRRPDAEPLRRDRRARAALRRRHLHARRLRVARHHGQPRRAAVLRRGRGLLAQALRDLGPARRAAAGPDRLLDHRREGDRPLHAAGVSRQARADDRAARGPARPRRGGAGQDRERLQRGVPRRHVRPRGARRLPHRGTRAGQDALGASARHAALLRLRAQARASRSPTSA